MRTMDRSHRLTIHPAIAVPGLLASLVVVIELAKVGAA